jgi:hypothetical protein
MRFLQSIVVALAITFSGPVAATEASTICERAMARAADTYKVPLGILYAAGLTERAAKVRSSLMH